MKTIRHLLGLIAAIAIGAVCPNQSHAAQMRTLSVGVWQGGSYSNDQSKQFSHCAAATSYRSGILMIVSISRTYQWNLAFQDPAWNLQIGQRIPIDISFDNGAPWSGTAIPNSKTMAIVPMADNSALITAFRAGLLMTINASGQTFRFDLGGTSRLMVALAQCVQTELAIEKGEPPPVFASSPPVVAPTRMASPPQPQGPSAAELQLAATRIASNLLLQAKLPNAQLLTPAETPEDIRRLGVAWKSDFGLGAVELLPSTAGSDSQHVASGILDADAAVCKADFASGRSSELVDDTVVTKVLSACKDSTGTRAIQYFIVHREGAPYVVYALVSTSINGASAEPQAPNEANFQAAAVRAAFSK